MNQFSKEEYNDLLSNLSYFNLLEKLNFEDIKEKIPGYTMYIKTNIKSVETEIDTDSLFDVIYKEHWTDTLTDLREFIHCVEFNKVALYINIFPDFAKWRLRIGK